MRLRARDRPLLWFGLDYCRFVEKTFERIITNMNTLQKGILVEGATDFTLLEYSVDLSGDSSLLKNALKRIQNLDCEEGRIVICLGRKAWDWLNPDWSPDGFSNFETLEGSTGYSMPTTQRDLFFYLNSNDKGDNFDNARAIDKELKSFATLELEQVGFRYHDSRDFTGFIDGTENPKEDARFEISCVADGEPGAGGSHVFSQKWVHNLEAFHSMPVEAQEKVIGRTKEDSVELDDDVMPDDSHVSRTDAKEDGVSMKIYRKSVPFGDVSEHGLFFLSFSCSRRRVQIQLERMTGATEDKVHDKLMEFSKPLTGSYWFAPSLEDLEQMLK